MSDVARSELLEHEPWRPGRGAKVALGSVVALLILSAVVDQRASDAEVRSIDGCAEQIEAASTVAMMSVAAMANYVRAARYAASEEGVLVRSVSLAATFEGMGPLRVSGRDV